MANHARFKINLSLSVFLLLSISLISSCANWLPDAHRLDVTQGNEIKREALDKIHVGMKKAEITAIIGNPMLKDPFHASRWDYIYRYVAGREQAKQSRVTLYFEGNKLIRIDDSEYSEPDSLKEKEE